MNTYSIFRYRINNKLRKILTTFILSKVIISINYEIDNLTGTEFRIRIDLILVNNALKKGIMNNIVIFYPVIWYI